MQAENTARASQSKKRTRIQIENEERILDAALDVFSSYGFRGATVDQIAEAAGMSKPNLLYYFRRKQDIYIAVLSRTLENWLTPLGDLDPDGEPEAEIGRYVGQKLAMSRDKPMESRLFAIEVIQGAPMMMDLLRTDLRAIVEDKAGALAAWIAAGKLAKVEPAHLIFMIWAMTQHYADFDTQIQSVIGSGISGSPDTFADAEQAVTQILFRGILPR
ncbi:TetR family transcriptional regulator C-terminal domain-containing protein [Methylobrevis pamukkalensis]|uniref:HTH-type transcriptional regulator RutR n=1 Tax=Methylobrevis pamukkalensis TaxID=1439726 RepID=A0A1E3H974_9HYPH|nr:TetR family transcriptional regulator C-terminal domain-containing protein [Methylobrevis pamukkalensis]ODN72041.1 HTH-type transcriptional regulator RutR [Methylobrevis pamukkalensis]